MTSKPLDTRNLLRRARENGHDALGIAHDPEAWQVLADGSRDRFLADGSPDALATWLRLTGDVAAAEALDAAGCEWVVMQLALLHLVPVDRVPGSTVTLRALTPITDAFLEQHPEHRDLLDQVTEEAQGLVRLLGLRRVAPSAASALFQGLAGLFRASGEARLRTA